MLSKGTSIRVHDAPSPLSGSKSHKEQFNRLGPDARPATALVADAFLAAARHAGYRDVTAAIAELVDNSLQAGATTIHVELVSLGTDDARMSVLDDGHGMSSSPLRAALLFGGSHRFNDRSGLGRFGMGLPGGSLSQARTIEVYSWTKKSRVLKVSLALDEASNRALISEPRVARLPEWARQVTSRTGTLVVWRHCDRLAGRDCLSVARQLRTDLGRIYREWLRDGVTVRVNSETVTATDPLFPVGPGQTTADAYGSVMTFEVRTATGGMSKIDVRFTELPVERWGSLSTEVKRRIGVLRGAPISVVRAGREIDRGWILMGAKRRENYDDWWRCEIKFEPELDEMFGVTNNKQGVTPTHALRSILEPELELVARQLNSRVRKRFQRLRTSSKRSLPILTKADRHLPAVAVESAKGDREYAFRGEALSLGAFYTIEQKGRGLGVVLNTGHPLYRHLCVKGKRRRNPSDVSLAEKLIAAAARAELSAASINERKTLARFKDAWGDALAAFLKNG